MIDSCGIFLTGSSWHTRFLAYLMKNKVFDEESKLIGEKWIVRTVILIRAAVIQQQTGRENVLPSEGIQGQLRWLQIQCR